MAEITQKTINSISNILENINYNYNRFCANVYDISRENQKALNGMDKEVLTENRDEILGTIGIHNKQTTEKYKEWYKDIRPKTKNPIEKLLYHIPTSMQAIQYRQEAFKLANKNIKIDNLEEYNINQIKTLNKAALAGYDISRLQDPNLSATDMRIAIPYLEKDIALNPESIRSIRRQEYKETVMDFFENVIEAELEQNSEENKYEIYRESNKDSNYNEKALSVSKEKILEKEISPPNKNISETGLFVPFEKRVEQAKMEAAKYNEANSMQKDLTKKMELQL